MTIEVREQERPVQAAPAHTPPFEQLSPSLIALATMVVCALVLFGRPLFTSFGALQWDGLEVHYYNLAFSVDQIRSGAWPLWTPHIFGGFPQIADPQVALWYPVNWIFFLVGLPADGLMGQLAFHHVLAGFGAFLLARRISSNVLVSIGLGCTYAFGGFMVGHASHFGMQNTAAWLPLLTLLLLMTLERRSLILACVAATGLGVAILAGHFQTALFSAIFLGLLSLSRLIAHALREPAEVRLRNGGIRLGLLLVVFIGAAGISAVQILPTYELAPLSVRNELSREVAEGQRLELPSLVGVINYDHDGVARGPYSGPVDRTQNYLFLGPIAIGAAAVGVVAGLRSAESRALAAFFLGSMVLALLFSLGRPGGVHGLAYDLVPFFDKIRAPTNAMFVANLSVLMLAAYSGRLLQGVRRPRISIAASALVALGLAVPVVFAASQTDLLYARTKADSVPAWQWLMEERDRSGELERIRTYGVSGLQLNEPQLLKLESFDGYNPLGLQRHARYVQALPENRQLAEVAGIRFAPCPLGLFTEPVPLEGSSLCANERAFDRLTLIPSTITASNADEALQLMSIVDLHSTAVLEREVEVKAEPAEGGTPGIAVLSSSARHITAQVTTTEDSFLFFNEAYYNGWQVSIDGRRVPLYRANYLFQGVPLSRGTHEVTFSFSSPAMTYGAGISVGTLVGFAGVGLVSSSRRRREDGEAEAHASSSVL